MKNDKDIVATIESSSGIPTRIYYEEKYEQQE